MNQSFCTMGTILLKCIFVGNQFVLGLSLDDMWKQWISLYRMKIYTGKQSDETRLLGTRVINRLLLTVGNPFQISLF